MSKIINVVAGNFGRISIPKSFRIRNDLQIKKSWEEHKKMEFTIEYGLIYIRPFDPNNWQEKSLVGIVRALDVCGRICIPKEYRELIGISENDQLEMLVGEDSICLRKIKK